RLDLHLHTQFSHDCDTPLERIEAHALAASLTGLAVTDHNTIEGALRLRDRVSKLTVIVGEEISSRDGEIIGLFLENPIRRGLSGIDTIHAIHSQNGLVYLPHPFDRSRVRKTGGASLSQVIALVDIVEVFNGKAGRDRHNTLAGEFASRHGKAGAGGSDAHSLRAIGSVYNEFETEDSLPSPAGLLAGLSKGITVGTRRSPLGGWLVRGRRPVTLMWNRFRR
ncbi:MAG TPA: PHP domain-containing protein, partial [Chthonomonadales bacterium]|nr:PHP domain-containing protein [Chthonomonadales bacterium]